MRHKFLVLTVKNIKIGVHLRKLKQSYHFFGPLGMTVICNNCVSFMAVRFHEM